MTTVATTWFVGLAFVFCLLVAAAAAAQPTEASASAASLCFGNEPSWSLDFSTPGEARLTLADAEAAVYRGRETRNEPLQESVWRGALASGGGDLVVFLAETACSDGMSDDSHPATARVSLPDGRFLAGCCRVPRASGENADAVKLEGVSWRLVSASGIDPATLGALRRPITALFASGRVAGASGCNQYSGAYALDGDRVTVGPLVATKMACPEPALSIESAFQRAFSGGLRAVLSGSRLELTADAGSSPPTTLQFEAEPAPTLEGVTWEVTGFDNGRSAIVSVASGTRLTLSFRDGNVSGSGGCNTFRAPYELDGERLELQLLASTRRMCPETGVMEQEKQFLGALQKAAMWQIRGELLDLFAAGGSRVVAARKVSG